MKTVRVELGENSYSIHVGAGLLGGTAEMLKRLGCSGRAVIITDPIVKNLYGNSLKRSLLEAGFKAALLEIPVGEEHKSLETAGRLYGELTALGAERGTPVLALGGGVVGDVAGFVAATYVRGVPLVQLPTTLLAQVDSSIGGKVAVNHGQLKNRIGAFYQPRAVIADISTLRSLPPAEITSGLAEVIKYAIIRDAAFFTYLEKKLPQIQALDEKVLEHVVTVCAGIKADVVARDEKDLELRNILNFGHTVGHAIETVTDFGVSHGQAVAVGMVAACVIAVEMGVFEKSGLERIRKLLKRAGLMTRLPHVDLAAVMAAMSHDKKAAGGKIRFVLPRAIGQVFVTDEVSPALVRRILVGLR
jgi:3-dehydroquinate synthase